jgi:uncharacterized membrane protein
MNWVALGKVLWGLVEPIIGPIAVYFKGRSDAKTAVENKAMRRTTDAIEDADQAANDARDRVARGELRDGDYRD